MYLLNVEEAQNKPGEFITVQTRVPLAPNALLEQGAELSAPVDVELEAGNENGIIHIWGHLKTRVRLACDRCLAFFERDLQADLDVSYTKGRAGLDDELNLYTGSEIDLEPALVEAMALALPMKRLCHDACRGLCPACGQDLNQGSCDCQEVDIDPRLAVLAELWRKHE